MCGRYTYTQIPELDPETIVLPAGKDIPLLPRYNIAPTNYAPVIPMDDPRHIHFFRWGLIPHWAEDMKIGYKLINARSETVLEKASFRDVVRRRRCLVLGDSFYEWKKAGKDKQPMRIGLKGFSPFYMAGLADSWTSPDGQQVQTYTILTTEPNELMAEIHDRMPVILPKAAATRWLNPQEEPESLVVELCRPFDSLSMKAYEVGKAVGNVRNDDASLIERQ